MANISVPVYPQKFTFIFPTRRCGGLPTDNVPNVYEMTLNLNLTNLASGAQIGNLTFAENALALFKPNTDTPTNLTDLQNLFNKFTVDFASWLQTQLDSVYNQILKIAQSGIYDCTVWTYRTDEISTRVFSNASWTTLHELGHQIINPDKQCPDQDVFHVSTRTPGILIFEPGGVHDPSENALQVSPSCEYFQVAQYLLTLEDGRLVNRFQGEVVYSCFPAHFSCPVSICVTSGYVGCFGQTVPQPPPLSGITITLQGTGSNAGFRAMAVTGANGCTPEIFTPGRGYYQVTADAPQSGTASVLWGLVCGGTPVPDTVFCIVGFCFCGCAGASLPGVQVSAGTFTDTTGDNGCTEGGIILPIYQEPNPGSPPTLTDLLAEHDRFLPLTATIGDPTFGGCVVTNVQPDPPYYNLSYGLQPDDAHHCWCNPACLLPVSKTLLLTDSVLGVVTLHYSDVGAPWLPPGQGFPGWYGEIDGSGRACGCDGGGGKVYYSLCVETGVGTPPVTFGVSYSMDGAGMMYTPGTLWFIACCDEGCGTGCDCNIPQAAYNICCPSGDAYRNGIGVIVGVKTIQNGPVICPPNFVGQWSKLTGICLMCREVLSGEEFPCGPCDAWDNQAAVFTVTEA